MYQYFISYYGSLMGFPGGPDGKAPVCNVGDLGSIPGLEKSPGEGNGRSHGWRSLVGYSPRGRKELDTTERLHFVLRMLPLSSPIFLFFFSYQNVFILHKDIVLSKS